MQIEHPPPQVAGVESVSTTAAEVPLNQSPGALARADFVDGLSRWTLWGQMGWHDIRLRYRRSVLGPFWLTISMTIMIVTLGILYSKLFGVEIEDYLPFLTLGFLAWGLISTIANEGCTTLTGAGSFIDQIKLPFTLYIFRMVWRNLIIFGHNAVVYVGVAIFFGIWPGAAALLVIPGLILIVFNGVWVALLFAMLCARFRDVPQIVASIIQVAFFLTPIIWRPELLKDRVGYADINPFFHFVELIRAPLLGGVPTPLTWGVALGTTVAGGLLTALVFRRYRARIPFWI